MDCKIQSPPPRNLQYYRCYLGIEAARLLFCAFVIMHIRR